MMQLWDKMLYQFQGNQRDYFSNDTFRDSDDDSDDGEVLNELEEYGNVGQLCLQRAINSFYRDDLACQCMIDFRKFVAYFDPFLPMNIITRKAYNTIMVEGLEITGKNLVAIVRDVYVFVGSFTYIMDFVILKDTGTFILRDMAEVLMGKPFRKVTKLEYDCAKGLMSFTRIFDNYTFQMPHTIPRYVFVGIKRLLDDLRVTDAKVCVTAAKLKIVLFINFNEKYAK
ncbi:hypothetical protein Tco_0935431 [Tanacetum coccineum]